MAKSVFEQIKKQNGERFAKAIRGYDNGIFDIPGIVDIVKYAGREAEPIMEYLESLKQVQIEESGAYQDPITLLDAAGYDAYYVDNLEEQNRIESYYATAKDLEKLGISSPSIHGEALCTFRDPSRFEKYHIINAVRKDVDQIKREDFIGKERREDEYGTSVLSIQILKSGGFISIKNRYNHTVDNPDNTFGSNPDRIIPGLSNALRHHFNTDFSAQKVRLPQNYAVINNQIFHYHCEENNIYFGSNFYVSDGTIHPLKSHEMMVDTHVLDLKTKTLIPLTLEDAEVPSTFDEVFSKEIEGYDIIVRKENDGQHLFLHKPKEKGTPQQPDIDFMTIKDGTITALNLPTTTEIGGLFMVENRTLETFRAPNLKKVGFGCLKLDREIHSWDTPLLEEIGDQFLYDAQQIRAINLPSLKIAGNHFLNNAYQLSELSVPQLERIGHSFLSDNRELRSLSAPELVEIGYDFIDSNHVLNSLYAPKLKSVGSGFLKSNWGLETLDLPSVEEIGPNSLTSNKKLSTLNLPAVKVLGNFFCWKNNMLRNFDFPSLVTVGDEVLSDNRSIESLNAPKLKKIGNSFLEDCFTLKALNLPQVTDIGHNFLRCNLHLTDLNLPSVKVIGDSCMTYTNILSSVFTPRLESLGDQSFLGSDALKSFYAPSLKNYPKNFLFDFPDKKALWESRAQLPPQKKVQEKSEEHEKSGISGALQQAEGTKTEISRPIPEVPKGISERLQKENSSPDHQQPNSERSAEKASLFKKLRDMILPHT